MDNAVSSRIRALAAPVAVAVAYGAAAWFSLWLTRGTNGIAAMWPASGILLAGLLRLPGGRGAVCVVLAALASFAANCGAGAPPAAAAIFTLANMVEAMLAATLLRRWKLDRPSFTSARDVGRFCQAVLAAAVVSATIATVGDHAGVLFMLSSFATVTLGMLIVAPLVLIGMASADPDAVVMPDTASRTSVAALLALVAAATLVVFAQERYPLLFIPLVALLAATWRLGPLGAATGVGVIAVIAPAMTGIGHGPLQLGGRSATENSFFLQFYLLMSFATALPFGARLAQQRRLAADLAESERMHRLLADSSTDVILRLSMEGVVLYCSPAVGAVLGFTPEQTVGKVLTRFVHPDDRAAVQAAWNRAVTSELPEMMTLRQARADGSHAWLEVAYRRVATGTGQEVVARARDISQRRAAELAAELSDRQVREANRLLGMAERAAQVGHWRLHLADYTMFWSPEVYRIHGMTGATCPNAATAVGLYHPDDRTRVSGLVTHAIHAGEPFEYEARIVRPDGEVRHVASRGQPEIGTDGSTTAMFGVLQDVTRRIQAEQSLKAARAAAEAAATRAIRLADTDALTGLASRRRALADLDEAIAAGGPLALAIFDIDHFKSVNDRFGHPAGDAVLRRVARVARHAVRPTDLVGRLGGEEFVVILPGANAKVALALADTLRRAVAASADGIDAGPPVTTSVGVAVLVPGQSAAHLLGEADRALYAAKAAGRNAAKLAA